MKSESKFRNRANPGLGGSGSHDLQRRLTDWPPETEYEPRHHAHETRKGPAIVTALILLGMALYFYWRL